MSTLSPDDAGGSADCTDLPIGDLTAALSDENAALRLRLRALEAQVREYESTMATLQASRSWRMTTPLRLTAGRVRRIRARAHNGLRTLARRSQPAHAFPTRGLFGTTVEFSPARIEVANPLARRWPRRHRILVVVHVHYGEVWHEIAHRLGRIPEGFDLAVSVTSGQAEEVIPDITGRFPRALIHVVPNRGRDQGPLALFASRGAFDGYDAVLKVHTKRSLHRMDGDAWRTQLLESLLPSPEGIARILQLLRGDAGAGLIAPAGNIKGPEHWGSNLGPVTTLAERIGLAFDPEELVFPAGAMYWADPWVLQQIALLGLQEDDLEPEAGHIDGSTAHALERFIGLICARAGLHIVPTDEVASRVDAAHRDPLRHRRSMVRALAFYLPQYHRIPENDAWWGAGFTDWVNVDKAQPLFRGHRQPLNPGLVGRYDLSDPGVLRQQAAAIHARGVDGVVMHHYWFDGTRLLDTPLRNLLADPSVELPFALCWANEPWTRRWDGLAHDILMAQRFGPDWADRFYDDIRPALQDTRYLRVGGHPLLILYRVGLLPDAAGVIARWKERAVADGFGGLHVLGVVPGRDFEGLPSSATNALDGLVRFPPLSGVGLDPITSLCPDLNQDFTGEVYSYDAAVDGADLSTRHSSGLVVHPGVMPGWDNTARRGTASYIFHGATPIGFRRWFDRAVAAAAAGHAPEPLVFINAWNEWAEGAALEADAFASGLPRRRS